MDFLFVKILNFKFVYFLCNKMDEVNFALMASLDLSAAFDKVNINILIKRLKIIGLPQDVST